MIEVRQFRAFSICVNLRLSAVNENDYYLYSCSPHEIACPLGGKTVISQGKFVVNLKKQAKIMKKTGEKE